jgi:hypothetical protein
MVQALEVEHSSTVHVGDGAVVLDGLVEADPTVVAVVSEAGDPELAVHTCLQIGARMSRAAQASIDSGMVERAFNEMTDGFGHTMTDALEQIVGTTEGLVDENDGALPMLLRQLRADLATQLEALFDADSKSSALARMEEVFSASANGLTKSMRTALDPSDKDSPLGQWKSEVLGTLQDSMGLVLLQVTELRAAVAAGEAHDSAFALTAVKGFTFEERVHATTGAFAARYGDLAEHVGTSSGSEGRRTGDEVVALNAEDTGGRHAAFVIEAKDRKLGLRKTLEELDRAMANRDASVGIAVFSSAKSAPTAVPFTYYANKAIAVLDPDDGDDRPLELAYMWARWEARKALVFDGAGTDIARVEAAMSDARRALARSSTVRGCHTRAKKQIDLASGELDALVADTDTALAALRLELGE